MRERLIELLKQGRKEHSRQGIASALKLMEGKDWCNRREDIVCGELEFLADYILENGVIVPPVNVEDTIYYLFWFNGTKIGKARVEEIYFNGDSFAYRVSREWSRFDLQENEVFLSREAAENALKEREKG